MSKIKILVVEDEVIIAIDIKNRLTKLGYTVTAIAFSGEEAINKATDDCPDLVLMDINLKGNIDGVEAAAQISDRFNIPIIYLTANADNTTLERAKATEPLGYLLKPFKEKELHTTIEITLSKYKTEKKLKESEQWLATVLKSISDAVITSDIQGVITFMNPVAEALTGWKQEDAFGKSSKEVFNIAYEKPHIMVESAVSKTLQGVLLLLHQNRQYLLLKTVQKYQSITALLPLKMTKEILQVRFWSFGMSPSASGQS